MQYVNRSRILAQDFRECTCFWARFSLEAGVSGSAFQCLLEFIFKLTDKNNNKTSKIKSQRDYESPVILHFIFLYTTENVQSLFRSACMIYEQQISKIDKVRKVEIENRLDAADAVVYAA